MSGKATKLGPNHQWELASRTSFIVTNFLRGADIIGFILPIMLVFENIM
jgi:transformation/transcription domain-associated protein